MTLAFYLQKKNINIQKTVKIIFYKKTKGSLLLLIFTSFRAEALSEAKKSNIRMKNMPFHVRSGNEP